MNREEYLMQKLSEECIEVSKEISKLLCFGFNERMNEETPTNIERVIHEINDLFATIEYLQENKLLPEKITDRDKMELKKIKIYKYMLYSYSIGIIKD